MQVSGEFPISNHSNGDQMLGSSLHKRIHPYPVMEPGSAGYDDKKDGWKERMDDWKMQQHGHLGHEHDDFADTDMAM